ncbi:SUF system NifU family Fe-S cluster assembly protein [soil metagenome]
MDASIDPPLTEAERLQLIEELHRARHGVGLAASFDAEGHRRTPSCGDEVTVRLRLDGARITAFSWEGHGCVVSMAAASALAAMVVGVEDFPALAERYFATVAADGAADPSLGDAEAFVGVGRFPLRAGCASLAWRATLEALAAR